MQSDPRNTGTSEEESLLALRRLCSLIRKLQQQNLKLARATYKVEYYRKHMKSAQQHKKTSKWQDVKFASGQLQQARLFRFRLQEETIKLKSSIGNEISQLVRKARVTIDYTKPTHLAIIVNWDYRVISGKQLEDIADEYEATIALNKILDEE